MQEVVIYTRLFCGFCEAAKSLLQSKQVNFNEIDATYDPSLREEMMARSGGTTFPQIFIGEQAIGGYDDLRRLETDGKLDALLG